MAYFSLLQLLILLIPRGVSDPIIYFISCFAGSLLGGIFSVVEILPFTDITGVIGGGCLGILYALSELRVSKT